MTEGTLVAPNVRDLDMLRKRLEDWLAPRMPERKALRITDLDYPRGAGQSHETILAGISWTEAGQEQKDGLVFRCKPGRFTVFPDDLFEQQFRVMEMLGREGRVRVAQTYWLEQDPGLLGAPFFVMQRVDGRVPVSVPPYASSGWVAEASPAQRRRMWETGVRQLALIQTVPIERAPFLGGPAHAPHGIAQEWDKYVRFVDWVQEDRPWPVLEQGLARLKSLWPANQPEGIVWGDARLGNMMFDEHFDVVAVMDWEQPSLGGALQDLGWFLTLSETMHGAVGDRPHLEGMGSREETIALWEEVSGKSAVDVGWYEEFTKLKMSCCGVRMAALRGAPPPDEAALARRLGVG